MFRCNESAGKYHIEADYLEGDHGVVSDEERFLDIMVHAPVKGEDGRVLEDIPYVSTKTGFEGEICVHELDWVSRLPGKVYSPRRRYHVKEIK